MIKVGGITVSVKMRLTEKRLTCYDSDNERVEGCSKGGGIGGGGGGGVQLAQVYSLHSDGLIPVRATAAQCPSGGLKIGAEAKNSAALCSFKAALTRPRPSRANLHSHI